MINVKLTRDECEVLVDFLEGHEDLTGEFKREIASQIREACGMTALERKQFKKDETTTVGKDSLVYGIAALRGMKEAMIWAQEPFPDACEEARIRLERAL